MQLALTILTLSLALIYLAKRVIAVSKKEKKCASCELSKKLQ